MNRKVFLPLAVCLGLAVPSLRAQEGDPARLKELDVVLKRLSAAASDIKNLIETSLPQLEAAQAQAQRGAGGPMTVADYVRLAEKECAGKFSVNDLKASQVPETLITDLVEYHECRAAVTRSPAACDALAPFKSKARPDDVNACKRDCANFILARSIISKSPDAMDRCRELMAKSDPPDQFSQQNIPKACAIMIGPGDALTICSKLSALARSPMDAQELQECAENIGMLKGESAPCAALDSRSPKARRCLALAAAKKAQARGDAKLCGDSPFCRLVMGDAGACGAYVKRLRGEVCRASAQEQAPLFEQMVRQKGSASTPTGPTRFEQIQAKVALKKQDVDALVMQVSADIEGFEPKTMPGFPERKERFRAIIAPLDQAMKRFPMGGPKKGAAGSGPASGDPKP